jgi:hypothetical protein
MGSPDTSLFNSELFGGPVQSGGAPYLLSTAADYINSRVLRHAGQLRPGYTAGVEIQLDVLIEWQALIDEWNLDRNMPLTKPEYVYPITGAGYNANNRDYLIGPAAPAGNFIGPRPVKILKANLIFSSTNPPSRVQVAVLPWEDYGSISVLTVPASGVTTSLYYEALWPTGIVHFWPPVNANSIELWQNGALVAPATLATVVAGTFAPGYENAIIYTLAERCQYLVTKEMGKPNPKIAGWALKARQRVKNANAGNPKAYSDFQTRPTGGTNSGNLTLIGEP